MKLLDKKTQKAIRKGIKKIIKDHGAEIAAAIASSVASTLATLGSTAAPGTKGKKSNLAKLSGSISEMLTEDKPHRKRGAKSQKKRNDESQQAIH